MSGFDDVGGSGHIALPTANTSQPESVEGQSSLIVDVQMRKRTHSSSDLEKFIFAIDYDMKNDDKNLKSESELVLGTKREQKRLERVAEIIRSKARDDYDWNMCAHEREVMDAVIESWANKCEGNLCKMLLNLHDIVGEEKSSKWVQITPSDIHTRSAVKVAYMKAILLFHPANAQYEQPGNVLKPDLKAVLQKYTHEKIFHLLEAAWKRFESEQM